MAQCSDPVDSYSAISTLCPILLCFSVTTKSMSRYRGQEHCLHPKLQSTKRFIKWYNAWNEKRRYPRLAALASCPALPPPPPTQKGLAMGYSFQGRKGPTPCLLPASSNV